jgi:biopolymer transport protein ExbD
MRLRSHNSRPAPHPINVTPMIDVVMCLIVFYLIVGKLAADQRSNIRLPQSHTGTAEKVQDAIVVNMVPGPDAGIPRIVIDAADVPLDRLEATLHDRLARRPDSVVELRGSRDLAFGPVARVIRACKNAGVQSVRLAAERLERERP